MRIFWRGLELPGRVVLDSEVSNESYGRFTIEPFEQGFGTTIGNSLRRVLLSSLEGAAVTAVKIESVSHEFASIEGVVEDVIDILLNIKGIVLRYDGDETKTMFIRRDSSGPVRAGDIEADASIEVVNPDHLIATMTADVPFHIEFKVRRGRGYTTAAENRSPEQEIDVIPIDSVFSPIVRVRYATEAMRVGQRTNYDRLILEIWTDGSVWPEDAVVEAALILRKHLNPFLMYSELGAETVAQPQPASVEPMTGGDSAMEELLSRPISSLDLSVRANHCLEAARVMTIGELVGLTEGDLLRFRSFGKTSLHEVERKLGEMGLGLGMRVGDGAASGTEFAGAGPAGMSMPMGEIHATATGPMVEMPDQGAAMPSDQIPSESSESTEPDEEGDATVASESGPTQISRFGEEPES